MNYNLGQDMKPEAATQQFAITGYKREIDIANGRQRVEQTRTPKFAYFQGPQPQTQIQGLDGEIAFNVNPAGAAVAASAALARDAIAAPTSITIRSPLLRAAMDRKTTRHRTSGRSATCARPTSRPRSAAVDDDHRRGGRAAVDLVQGV